MTSLTKHTPSLPPIERLHQLQQQLEAIDNTTDAAAFANDAKTLAAALKAANTGIDVRNEAAELHLRAERKLGSLLREVIRPKVKSVPDGIDRQRAHRACQLAAVPHDLFEEFITQHKQNRREFGVQGALKLLPKQPREDRSNIAAIYTAPSVDTQIARELGIQDSDERAELIVHAINTALATMENPRHAYVWAKHHGINDDGTIGESWTYAGIAQKMGVSREYVENLYYRASHHVRGHIAVAALDELAVRMHAA